MHTFCQHFRGFFFETFNSNGAYRNFFGDVWRMKGYASKKVKPSEMYCGVAYNPENMFLKL